VAVELLLVIIVVIGIGLAGAIVWLQTYLCKQDKHWYGLILPGLSSIFATVGCISIMQVSFGSDWFAMIYWYLPSVVMVVIYYFTRKNLGKKNKELF